MQQTLNEKLRVRQEAERARIRRLRRALSLQGHQGPAGAVALEDAGAHAADRRVSRRGGRHLRLSRPRPVALAADDDGQGRGRLRRAAGARQPLAAARCRRPHRPARRQRQRQVDADQTAGRAPYADRRRVGAIGQAAVRLFRPAPDRRAGRDGDAGAGAAAQAAARRRGGDPQVPRPLRFLAAAGRHQDRRSVRRREGAPVVRADELGAAAHPAAGRADQPPRRDGARGADPGGERLRRRRGHRQPRPAHS